MARYHQLEKLIVLPLVAWGSLSMVSCRATSPLAAHTKSSPPKAEEPVAAPKSEANLAVLRWVVATRAGSSTGADAAGWSLDLKTDSEVWCEARCSKFELIETVDGDTNDFGVKKTAVVGNTSPGMLDVKKQVGANPAKAAKVRLLNVGEKGQIIVLEDVVTPDRPNFYAVPMKISAQVDGEKSSLKGEFTGKTVELRLEKNASLPGAGTRSSGPTEAFVMGSLVETKDSAGKSVEVFWAFKVLPASEE